MTEAPLKVLIFIVSYNAERHIKSVLDRIPDSLWESSDYDVEVIVIDDGSEDNTVLEGNRYFLEKKRYVRVLKNPINQGYGGNQKIGFTYAIQKGFDIVALLHADAQYAPECLKDLLEPIAQNSADAVFGSRMLRKRDALKGGMPLYKFLGNIILTRIQNGLLGTDLSEFHTGYRIYRVKTLQKIPFQYNSNDFDFDTDIIIQLIDNHCRIKELPIPTHYGDEICNVNGIRYALQIMHSTFLSRVQKFGIYYTPKFDYQIYGEQYEDKTQFDSSHLFAISQVDEGDTVLDFGCGSGHIAQKLKEKSCSVYGYDSNVRPDVQKYFEAFYHTDIDKDQLHKPPKLQQVDSVLLLDVIEHLINPDAFLESLRKLLSEFQNPPKRVVITTGNVAFLFVRLSLLFGGFNYGKRGILDLTHKRLFTFKSLHNLLEIHGFKVQHVKGIPVPIPFIFGDTWLARLLLRINRVLIKISKGLFAFQIAMVATPRPTIERLLENSKEEGRRQLKKAMATTND
ncbi:MAG: glycosyltransferase [Hyphomicrobiales bacterium]|nr:glycosyltransferase [Hyphomicrobiales bacterium]